MQNTDSATETTAARVRAVLREKGVTGSELARRLDFKQPYISRRLTGEVEFRADELIAIAAVLDVPVAQFLPAAEPTTGGAR
jgi:transcriptional regulator with XRE-family HTH domain